jgi:hypothetical protein
VANGTKPFGNGTGDQYHLGVPVCGCRRANDSSANGTFTGPFLKFCQSAVLPLPFYHIAMTILPIYYFTLANLLNCQITKSFIDISLSGCQITNLRKCQIAKMPNYHCHVAKMPKYLRHFAMLA